MKNLFVAILTLLLIASYVNNYSQSLIISQYIETNSGTTPKGFEISNISGADITFSGANSLELRKGTNGGACSATVTITAGTLLADEVWVIGTSDLITFANANGTGISGSTTNAMTHNGDDAHSLYLGGVLQDMFGICGSDPGSAWTGGGVSTANLNIQILASASCAGDTDGWTDPSERFSNLTNGSDMTGFGNPPAPCVSCVAPITQASAGSSSGVTTNSGTINWTRGTGTNVLVVLQAGSAAGTPASGVTYTDNAIFGSGDPIGTGFVVYEGTGTTVNVTNLVDNTTYHYAIYEYATTGTCYLTPGLTGNFTTLPISIDSDIIASGGESTLVSSTVITPGPLTSTQGVKVWEFTIRDGGGAADADNLPTILEDLTITQSGGNQMDDWDIAIQSADLFDGTTLVGSGIITSNQITFTGMSITAADDANKTITMRISLNCPSNNANNLDGDDFGFRISQGNVTEAGTGTSQFASFPLINSTNALNEYDLNVYIATTVTPNSGPVGTSVTINASGGGFTGATAVSFGGTAAASFTIVSDTEITAEVASGTATGDIVITDQYCVPITYSFFTVIDNSSASCEGTVIFSDIIMSEIYDNTSGSLGYIEVYNGTGAVVDLTGYSIRRYPDLTGASTSTYTFPASGVGSSIANGQVLVGRISTGGAAGTHDFSYVGTGFNANDRLELYSGATLIDDFHDAVVGAIGYIYRRNTTITGPNPAFDATEWDATPTPGDITHLGTYNVSSGSQPSITAQPTTSQICAESDAVIAAAGAEGFAGGLGLTYQWFESAPGAAGWTAMTDGGVVSGVTSPTLTISPADGFDQYQYYCEVREDLATCFTASDAVQLDVYGSGGTAGLWTGNTNTDWCDCFNWHDGRIPIAATNVTIDETASNDCIATTGCAGVGSTLALSSLNGTNTLLTISGTGSVNITNALAMNKMAGTGNLIIETTGSGTLSTGSATITGSAGNNAILRNESSTTTVDINGNLTIAANGVLDLNPNGTINLSGDFLNNNSAVAFDEANSTVIFDGAAGQSINTNGFTEVFHNITLNKSGGVLTLQDNVDTDISGIIALSDDQIDLNALELRVLNPSTGAFTRTSGSLIEESGTAAGNNAGKLIWDIGTTAGVHSFPFAAGTGGAYIPFEFELTAGNAGEVSLSTYGTAGTNLPWPSAPEAVTNLNSTGGLMPDNRDATADRFWQIDVENVATADLTFSYQNSELPVAPFANHLSMIAQRYNSTLNQWEIQIHPGQTRSIIPGGYTVSVPNISTFSPWALANINSPLPAELIKFEAIKANEVAILNWATASEINTDEFILEKSKDGIEFTPFSYTTAAGNSNGNLEYQEIDYAPFNGYNYYRLKTVDFDGSFELSDVKTLYYGSEINNVVYNSENWILTTSDLDESQVQLINGLGQFVDLSSIISLSENGISILHSNLAAGIYIIQINNGTETINLKVIK
jgi:hypothetical protein